MLVIKQEFADALERLSPEDQKRVKEAVFKLMTDGGTGLPGQRRKKMKRADYIEYRASQSLRIIASQQGPDTILLFADQHDDAIQAAERGYLKGHVEDLARFRELELPSDAPKQEVPRRGPLAAFSDNDLQSQFKIPPDWIPALRSIRTEEQFASQEFETLVPDDCYWRLAQLFPREQSVSTAAAPTYRVLDQDILQRHFEGTLAELQYNLPPESWALIERKKPGAILVRGGPGSGKSLVLLYRALHLLETPGFFQAPRVLYVTFTNQLTEDTRAKALRLRGRLPSNFTIATVDKIAHGLIRSGTTIYDDDVLTSHLAEILKQEPTTADLDPVFVREEITDIIEWRGLRTLDEYLAARRTGRGQALRATAREAIWAVYERLRDKLKAAKKRTPGMARIEAFDAAVAMPEEDRYDAVLVDELQDLSAPAIGMLINLAAGTGQQRNIMMVGDGGQSIYNRGFTWREVGLRFGGANVFTLKACERSSQEILDFASALAGGVVTETDGDAPSAASLHGDVPRIIEGFEDRDDQRDFLVTEVRKLISNGTRPDSLAVLARSQKEITRIQAALELGNVPVVSQGDYEFYKRNAVRVLTCHSAKGLEFSQVYIVGVDDGSFPLRYDAKLSPEERSAYVAQDLRLLYVAATRARHRLTLLCGIRPSPFLDTVRTGDVSKVTRVS